MHCCCAVLSLAISASYCAAVVNWGYFQVGIDGAVGVGAGVGAGAGAGADGAEGPLDASIVIEMPGKTMRGAIETIQK